MRSSRRAPGRVRRGTTAVSMAMKVDTAIVIVPLQTRIDVRDFEEIPPETNCLIGNGGMGRGLQAEPLVMPVAALQPPLWS